MAAWANYDRERDAQRAPAELAGIRYYQRIEEEHQAERGTRRAAARSREEISVDPDPDPDPEPEGELSW